MKLHLILARARNGVIGVNGQLPWHLPEDMAHFKRATMGSPVIMGRKTWESLPTKFRPLPGRLNIVVTRQDHWQAEGALVARGLPEACALCPPESSAWVIGGAELYAQALALADAALVTEIEADFEGDAFAPTFAPDWVECAREPHVAASGLHFSFVSYQRRSAANQV
ncbi:MAG: dihydrofolate reductase [Gammaproteobacteria bacterium]|uniref:dihydrofolate reductase n=1 Tax=Rhodoferax sp. TaxID=50421 RepID=UPI001827B74A|nr:dihydrofolate reductase [Rhodoferax sp.]MBU3900033.1 dihydrofolate reductase [Gammaproteobacteria bacterium]MBA3059708.1 dihydrofolate reductase [Rhodoferax sp.]MBU3999397.1 dihydrofolate reductase [Gammaproteobacteria bacterium]MBU4082071.1 dihydrofolate reductase [Gammaproteobacteria bacterium]MBU4113866.1 dihydrofolate reductase [Gammaproteobacteria bacterium]